jgi:hypothetical protein
MRMKKLLWCGLLGVMALALTAQDAFAWGWLKNHCCGCSGRCNTTLTIKPYNAFSPVAYGSIVADGCMPVNIYGGQLPCQPSCFNNGGGYNGMGGCCANGVCTMPQGAYAAGIPMQQSQPIYYSSGTQFVVPSNQMPTAQFPVQYPSTGIPMIPAGQMPTTQFPVQYPNNGLPMIPAVPGVQPVGYQTPAQGPAYWYNNQ